VELASGVNMKFFITLNVPTKNGMSHQIVGDYPAKTLEEFQSVLHQEDFIMVTEWKRENGELQNGGKLLINQHYVGKVRIYDEFQ